jgi:phage N-6-adenine-methyltransferase
MDTTTKSTLWRAGGPGFSSASPNWATPQAVFDALDHEFSFELDAAASPTNAKCRRFYTIDDDGLAQDWHGVVWLNPPYGRGICAWLKKAADSAEAGATVVCLIPARTDTAWWHDHVLARAAEVRLVRGRLSFGDGSSPAPFPSAIVVYRPAPGSLEVSGWERPQGARQ